VSSGTRLARRRKPPKAAPSIAQAQKEPRPMRRRTCLKISTLSSLAFAAMLALSAAASAETADRFQPAAPEPGAEIPSATIKFGMRPYADNPFYIIGMKKGWFDEVGVKFDPAPYGLKA